MAKQGFHKFERTFGCVIFYRVGDRYYIRQKSRLSKRRVKTSKRFANTMASARRLGNGSYLAASVYRELPEAWKMFELYRKLTGIATRLLKDGMSMGDTRLALEHQLYEWGYRKEINYPTIQPTSDTIVLRSPEECQELENASIIPKQVIRKKHQVSLNKNEGERKRNQFLDINRHSPSSVSRTAANPVFRSESSLIVGSGSKISFKETTTTSHSSIISFPQNSQTPYPCRGT